MTTRRWRGGAGEGHPRGRAWHRVALLVPVAVLAAGCNEQQSALAPKSHASSDIASLFWWMMGIAWAGLLLVVCLMLFAWRRAHRRGLGSDDTDPKAGEKTGWRVVVGAGVIFPIVLIAALFIVADVFVIGTTEAPA